MEPLDGSGGGDALLGILACSVGQYCVESKESTLGGYCVLDPHGWMEVSRKLQDDGSLNISLFESTYEQFCVEDGICNCTNIDRDTYTLDVLCPLSGEECYNVYSQCFVNLTMCVASDYTYSLTGSDEYKTKTCTEHSKPYYQRLCYELTVVDNNVTACSVEFNGVTCNSCEIIPKDYSGNVLSCYVFDCTNTPGNHSGSDCQKEGDVIYTMYRESYGCIENCSLCGEGFEMMTPNQLVNVSFSSGTVYEFECDFVSYLGQSSFISEADCERLSDITFEPCGCSAGLIPTGSPVSSSPSDMTTDVPSSLFLETETDAPSSATVNGPTSDATSAFFLNKNDYAKYSVIGILGMGITLAASSAATFM